VLQPQLADLLTWRPYTKSPDIIRADQPFPQLTRL
jgi:hypothetical protein